MDEVVLMSMDEILERAQAGEPFTPDSIHACLEYVKRKGSMSVCGPPPTVEFVN